MTVGLLVNVLLGLGLLVGIVLIIAFVVRLKKSKTASSAISSAFNVGAFQATRPEIVVINRLLEEDDKAKEEAAALARLKEVLDRHQPKEASV